MAAKTSAADGAGADAAGEALTLIVGPEQTRITVHRATLIAASPVFRDLITSCPDALGAGGVPLPEDDADAWALLAALLQPLCAGLDAITHGNAYSVLELVDKYDVRGARALVDCALALHAVAAFKYLRFVRPQGEKDTYNEEVHTDTSIVIEIINFCATQGLEKAEATYVELFMQKLAGADTKSAPYVMAFADQIESLDLAKRLLHWKP